jgi:hypothetical protein
LRKGADERFEVQHLSVRAEIHFNEHALLLDTEEEVVHVSYRVLECHEPVMLSDVELPSHQGFCRGIRLKPTWKPYQRVDRLPLLIVPTRQHARDD